MVVNMGEHVCRDYYGFTSKEKVSLNDLIVRAPTLLLCPNDFILSGH